MSLDTANLKGRVTIADGAWSAELTARGVDASAMAESANIERPELVAALVGEFVAAGSQIITTNTFGANRFNLVVRGSKHSVEQLNSAGVQIARENCPSQISVVGTMGPSGKILVVGEGDEREILDAFSQQARALAGAGADAILLETFSEPAEILLAIQAVRTVCVLPVIACMSFDSGPQRTRTVMGAEAGVCAVAIDAAGADVIGCNCCAGISSALPAVVALRAATDRPLWVKPSAGQPEIEDGRPVYRMPPEEFASYAPTLVHAGANVLGGCCGVGPAHIRKLTSSLRK